MSSHFKNRSALITGIGGQDGSYLSRLLLEKGYRVYGSVRNLQSPNLSNLERLGIAYDVRLTDLDLTKSASVKRALEQLQPDEIYNLASDSSVADSFKDPARVGISNGIAVACILNVICEAAPRVRFFQASSSEIFGDASKGLCVEASPKNPRNPYAAAKLYGHWITVNCRESYGLHATSGILFNHESPLRDIRFVTRKITAGVAAIHEGRQRQLALGNLDSVRDWGHARDYVKGMWMMLQQPQASDYVLASGVGHTVREFVELAFSAIGIELAWQGSAAAEIGIDRKSGEVRVAVDPRHFRVSEVNRSVGNPTKARQQLGWTHRTSFEQLIHEMVEADLIKLRM